MIELMDREEGNAAPNGKAQYELSLFHAQQLRNLTNRLVGRAFAYFNRGIRPIYGAKNNGRPIHLGTATLIQFGATKIILTAAHIIDENAETSLYIGGFSKLVLIEAEFTATGAARGKRKSDQYDFAFCKVTDTFAAEIGEGFISEFRLTPPVLDDSKTYYCAMGYPNTKNKKYNPRQLSVRANMYSYGETNTVDHAVASALPNGSSHHIFMRYGKWGRDENGQVSQTTFPQGMSGGPTIDVGVPSDLAVFRGLCEPVPLVAGLIIELKKNRTLLSTRIDVIATTIRSELGL